MKSQLHAYLIMSRAHSEQLRYLVRSLDYPDNDLYVHIDGDGQAEQRELQMLCKSATLTVISSISVSWAAFSQVRAELNLMEAAVSNENHYAYIHLLSESDLPIKSNEEIHSFFENCRYEFVEIESINDPVSRAKIKYYYLLQEHVGKKHGVAWLMQKILIFFEKIFRINRLKSNPYKKIAKGANWFSITEEFAKYVLGHESEIYRYFSYGRSADELFLQTILLDSPFKNSVAPDTLGNLRYVRWVKRNSPEFLTLDADYSNIKKSSALFARKFSRNVDSRLVDVILHLKSGND